MTVSTGSLHDRDGLVPAVVSTRGPRLLRPLREHDYRLLWLGESISSLGDQFQLMAMTWLVLGLSGSGVALGGVLAAAAIPRAVLMLVGGVASDRVSPRVIMLISNSLRAMLVGVLAGLVLTGTVVLGEVYALAVLFGISDAFFYPAIGSLVPRLLEDEAQLPTANALFQSTTQLMGLIGPPLAGLLIAAVATGPAFALNAASFVVAAGALLLIRWRMPATGTRPAGQGPMDGDRQAAPAAAPHESVLTSLRAGIAYVWHDRTLRLLLVMVAVINFAFAGPDSVGLAWLANGRWAAGAVGFGLLTGIFGLGALLGAAAAGSLTRPRHPSRIVIAGAGILGVGLAAIGVVPQIWMAIAIAAPMGVAVGVVNVLAISWLQARTDPAMLGRVMSLVMLASVGLTPVSLAIAGLLVDVATVPLFVAAGALVVGTAVFGISSGGLRELD